MKDNEILEAVKTAAASYEGSVKILKAMENERKNLMNKLKVDEHPWIGKLCWFSDEKNKLGKNNNVSILTNFRPDAVVDGCRPYGTPYRFYTYCKPVDDSDLQELTYKGE